MSRIVISILVVVFLFPQCKGVKYASGKLPNKQVIFGDGGGFAGIETSYFLLENGQVFKRIGTGGKLQELTPLKRKHAKELYAKISAVQIYKLDINKPGNLYYFLQEVNENIDSRATWGAGDYLPPQNLVNIHRELLSISKGRKLLKSETQKPESNKPEKKEEDNTRW